MKFYYVHCRKGFISAYYLTLLLIITTMATTITINIKSQANTLLYLEEINQYLSVEHQVTRILLCDLKNRRTQDYTLYHEEIQADIRFADDRITVYLISPVREILTYTTRDDSIYDYEVKREKAVNTTL